MDDQEFRRLVAGYEHASRHAPRRFARVTAAMAVFGYAAILGALALSAAGLGWGVAQLGRGRFAYGKVLLVVGCASLLWSLLRALWSRDAAPEGVRLSRGDAPRLFDLIDKVRKRCGAPAPHVVMLDGELNAAIVQQPRLGLLGWHRNHLILGLPLLMALDVKQLAAVIAHEFGHLHGAHGKLGAWVYRTRRSWWRLAESRERAAIGASIADSALALFFRYFFPRFNARAFVLSRQQEYEADRMAHQVVGAKASAEGLVSVGLHARFLDEEFWPAVYRDSRDSPEPLAKPYGAMQAELRKALQHPQAPAWLRDALRRVSDTTDTHPSLRDRLEFAEAEAAVPAPPATPAAHALLGESLAAWIERFDGRWKRQVAEGWARAHRDLQARRLAVQELAAARGSGPLDADDHLLWARAARDTEGVAAGEAVLRAMLEDHPGHADARFELAMALVDSGAAGDGRAVEGAGLLRGLGEELHPCSLAAGRRHQQWLEATERFAELKPWRERLRVLEKQTEAAWEALHDFDGDVAIEAARLGKRALRPLLDVLRREPVVGRAFLLRRQAAGAPGWRFLIVVVERARAIGGPSTDHWWADLRNRIELPCDFMVIDLSHPFWKDKARAGLVRQMTQVPDGRVYAGRRL